MRRPAMHQKSLRKAVRYWLLAGTIFCGNAQLLRAQEPPPQPPASDGAPATSTAWHRVSYSCDNKIRIQVSYRGTVARVTFEGQVHVMKQVLSADGGRYSDGKLVWWSKGNGGFLTDASDGGPSGPPRLADNCKQIVPKTESPTAPPG
jgi:membrane-bound inhibitor of C-type lysozyme